MEFKKWLRTLVWNDFSLYPSQGQDIFVHMICDETDSHRFVRVRNFNAVNFDFSRLVKGGEDKSWRFQWLPAKGIDEKVNWKEGKEE